MSRVIEVGYLYFMIFWGSSGIGKIIFVEVIVRYANVDVERIFVVIFGVKEIREAIERVR